MSDRRQEDTLDQQREEEEMDDIGLVCRAMAKAFPDIDSAVKRNKNPHFKSSYADFASVVDAVKPALGANGLWFTQVTTPHDQGVVVETVLYHESGQHMRLGKLFMPASKQDAQGFGSALTYAKRYSLMSAFGIPAEDDDGNAAVKTMKDRYDPIEVSPERAKVVRAVADACIAKHASGDEWGCYEERASLTDADEAKLLWSMLKDHSKVRSSIKHYSELDHKEKAAA